MRPFNLADIRIAERNYCRNQINTRLRVIVALALVMVLVAAASNACKIMVVRNGVTVKEDLAKWQSRCVDVKNDMSKLEKRVGQREWFKELGQGSRVWLGVLDSSLECLPGDVWLSKIRSSEASLSVSVDGHATSFDSVSVFVGKLRRSGSFGDVRLVGTRVSVENGAGIVDFSLDLKLKDADAVQSAQAPVQAGQVPDVGGGE